MTDERLTRCPLCGSARIKPLCTGHDWMYGDADAQRFPVARCAACRLVFLSTRPIEAEAGRFYPDSYAPYARKVWTRESAGRGVHLARRVTQFLDRATGSPLVEELARHYQVDGAGRQFLDFGCGSAKTLNRMKTRGWETLGIDVSEATIGEVRASGHRGLVMGADVWDSVAPGSLDLVRMNHVLEHVYRPREILTRLRERLAPGGVVHVALPNPESVTFRVFRSRWFPLDSPRHVLLPPPSGLQRLADEAGFSSVRIVHEVLTKDFVRSVGCLLHELGLMSLDEAMFGLLHRPLLNMVLYPSARLAALIGRADRYHGFLQVSA